MGPVTRVVQTGIGLVAELKAAKAEHNALESSTRDATNGDVGQGHGSPQQIEQPPPDLAQLQIDQKRALEVEEESDDDEHFGGGAVPPPLYDEPGVLPELDDESPPPYSGQELIGTDDVGFPERSMNIPKQRLAYPVIIPQRRPGSKIRGFVRAYAPVLGDYDIDQDAFLNFLKTFHKASQV